MERNADAEKAGPENEAADTKNRFSTIRAKRANHPLRQARPNDQFSGAAALA
jgi:hypothetical protein